MLLVIFGVTACSSPAPQATPVVAPNVSADHPVARGKAIVAADGPVALTRSDLGALGWSNVDPKQIRVLRGDQEVPVWSDDTAVRFYAVLSPTRYMTESVYWLEPRAPSALITEQPLANNPNSATDHYSATVRAEENRVYSPQVEEGDHWFWQQLPAPVTKTFTVTLTSIAAGPARLQIETWAATDSGSPIDHAYQIAVNGQDVGEDRWDGKGPHSIELALPDGLLVDGPNLVRISAPGLPDVMADTTYVNALEVTFPRHFTAQNDRLMFDSPGGAHALSGFSANRIDVFDVTQPDRITRTSIDPAQFSGMAGHQYWAVGPQGYQSVRLMAAATNPDLRAVSADYVAIGPRDLIEPLTPLLDLHRAEGLTTLAVPVDAIYDQFGDGRVDPAAIQAFLRSIAPKYVLLVGDASYDTLGYTVGAEANRLPTFLVQTVFGGETASDVVFAQPIGDLKPSFPIGRVPARTADQVRVFIDKTVAYLQSAPSGAWRQHVLAVADGQESSFKSEAQSLLDEVAAKYQTTLINPPANTPGANQQIIAALNEGQALVAYFGHGSVTQWGKDNLFTVKDTTALQNGRAMPILLNFTCLTGLFTHPKVQSLTETLLWQAGQGPVAVLAPTSLTLGSDQSFLSTTLVAGLMAEPGARLGDLVLKAWQAMPTSDAGQRDVLSTFLLFGDPALRIVQP
ncbi:MAG: C25 family cysteine peptidase [Anaerolineae bacterium]